ncbi:tetratricopeptide repeat protein [Anoxybacillus geothermalis]|nr:tetratricopeptide repeat protein [Anoxybacillus geothermalis]WJQ08632.1 tetratricopeptide repeat protein [Geobacillus stearothermophilus]WJQ12072.1 tetratricopeptide repeat protein [Geobacillus stearothermophilus]WJQ12492.1 tetratricopeptide repeat protein [Geobacillus stearothermophilus]
MLNKAIKLIEAKRYEEAQTILQSLLDAHPQDGAIYFYYATALDALGLERKAIPYYEKAIDYGIEGELRQRAFIQLGSSYRCIGEYDKAANVLGRGLKEFPENAALQAFLAMTLYHMREEKRAVSMLIHALVASSSDPWIKKYEKALTFYADHLDEVWD